MLETLVAEGVHTLKKIFRDHWSTFVATHPNVRDVIHENVEKMLACGDPDLMGYSRYECDCGHFHTVAHTCKSRFCNSCGKVMTDAWMVRTEKRLLNVAYHHVVFSPPSELWLLFRHESLTP